MSGPDVTLVGTLGTVPLHVVLPDGRYHMPQIIVRDISQISMAGGIRQWMGKRAKLSQFKTITFTKKDSTAISFENLARSYVGYVQSLSMMTAASLTDKFWCEVADLDVKHALCIPDSGNYDTATMCTWSCYLVRQSG